MNRSNIYRICLLGESGVGKTRWIRSLMGDTEPTEPSISADIHVFNAQTNQGDMTIEICDIPGNKVPFSPHECLYGFSHGFAIVYNDNDSRAKVKDWVRDIAAIVGYKVPAISVSSEEMDTLNFLEKLLHIIRSDSQLKIKELTPDSEDQQKHREYQCELKQAMSF